MTTINYQIIKPAQRYISSWAGGTTEELFIHPTGAQYRARDFAFRVSTAVVELGQSDFTSLPSITRWIATLEGSVRLNHEGHGQTNLEPLHPYCFDGGWTTRCTGTCTDFNLMLSRGWNGYIAPTPRRFLCAVRETVGIFAFGAPVQVELFPSYGDISSGIDGAACGGVDGKNTKSTDLDDKNHIHRTIPTERILLAHRDMFVLNSPCTVSVSDGCEAQSILFKAWAEC